MAPVVLGLGSALIVPDIEVLGSETTGIGWSNPPFALTLPSGVQAGELLIAIFGEDDDPSSTGRGAHTISGFTRLYSELNAAGEGNMRVAAFYKVADGNEGATVDVTRTGGGVESSGIVMRIAGWDDSGSVADSVAVSSVAEGNSSSPNSPSLTPAWGDSRTSLWLSVAHSASGEAPSSLPANYGDLISVTSSTTPGGGGNQWNARQSVAFRTAALPSDDPGSFTLNSGYVWSAATIAIKGK